MTIYQYKNFIPQIGRDCYLAPSAVIIGRVTLEDGANIWHGCVLRGDVHDIFIGKDTNIQDLSLLHVAEKPLYVGRGVTVGHHVVLHACTIGDHCLIGMGAVILDGAQIGENSVVAAGALVPPGKIYPPRSMIMGSPAKVARDLRPDEIETYGNHYKWYVELSREYQNPDVVKLL
ncbi:MAG: gamma carbonic anhydrase family protein [Pseudomonadota bacterium]